MRILLIIPELSLGGAQRSLSKLSLEFARHNQVWLVVFNKLHTIPYNLGGELLSLNVTPTSTWWSKIVSFASRVRRLKKVKKKLNIDVAISFLEGADYINVLSRYNEKVVLSIRGSKVHDENMIRYFFWLRSRVLIPWLYKKADCIITVNEGIRQELIHQYKIASDKIFTIPNFYNRPEIKLLSLEKREAWVDELYTNKIIITSGRLAIEKGIKGLISVLKILKATERNITLVVIGDGPQHEELVQYARHEGLDVGDQNQKNPTSDIVFLGSQKNVFKYLRGADLYLLNSSSEGFPNGLVEAMICGVPVMSSNCPYGPQEILAPGINNDVWNEKPLVAPYGILMPVANRPERVGLWADTIKHMLHNENLLSKIAMQAAEHVRIFDKEEIIKTWFSILNDD
jgi:glycosyltransferase involved in cell wall biosynthesis